MEHCKVNGVALKSMDGVILKPNDRICLGPSAIFLFKNKAHEGDASMEDTDENPISFDTAAEEVAQNENLAEKAEQEKVRADQEAAAKKMVAELEAKMEAERAANAAAFSCCMSCTNVFFAPGTVNHPASFVASARAVNAPASVAIGTSTI